MKNEIIFENIANWFKSNKIEIEKEQLENFKLGEIEVIDSLLLISLILEIEILKDSKFNLEKLAEISDLTLIELINKF